MCMRVVHMVAYIILNTLSLFMLPPLDSENIFLVWMQKNKLNM